MYGLDNGMLYDCTKCFLKCIVAKILACHSSFSFFLFQWGSWKGSLQLWDETRAKKDVMVKSRLGTSLCDVTKIHLVKFKLKINSCIG